MAEDSEMVQVPSPEKVTWVGCDRCGKWRQVPKAVADALDDTAKWYCSDNSNPAFSSCDAPQELSDDEIDRAVGNAASQGDESPRQAKSVRPVVWQHVKQNLFTHRSRKIENEDDIMVCQCRPPHDGSPGCGENCLNRLLNQECNPDFCPCGAQCSNTQFTKRQYSDIEQRRAGPKGFGLFTKQPLKAGQFVIEYVGEVLEEEEYMRRKLFYQEIGQRHYYFMNVGNGEVIDACRKGGLGRFINHSCDPNCETQKWVVHGELAIGLFVLKDVSAGEELTFDYNFERYGDKALRCYCNSKNCRGYIGGTPEEHDVDKDDDENMDASNDPEPIMVAEEDAYSNPACQAILANEVGLAPADFQDDTLRRGWEELAAKYGVSLDWELISKALPAPADSAQESKAANGAALSAASFEAVEQKLKETKAQRRLHSAKAVPPKKRLSKDVLGANIDAALSPASTSSARQKWQAPTLKGFRRRSEVDRRLDTLVATSGRLRDGSTGSIVRMLRLFNLCDLGASTGTEPGTAKAITSFRASSHPQAELLEASSRSGVPVFQSRAEASSGGNGNLFGARHQEAFEHHAKKRRLNTGDASPRSSSPDLQSNASDPDREDGELAERLDGPQSVEDRDVKGTSRDLSRPEQVLDVGQLNARQRSRMADVSLLLEVILKTSSSSTKRQFCNCGILRQLQSVLGRCTGPAYAVIVKKILRAIEHLPLTAEDMHQYSSAHGSFSDTLWTLGGHNDYEIRNRARTLRERFPLDACSKEVQEASRVARAVAAARRARHPDHQFPPPRRRPHWGDAEWRDPVTDRFSRPTSGRSRFSSKFHGPTDTPGREGAGKESWSWRSRERESMGSQAPIPASDENGNRRGAIPPSPMLPSLSAPLPVASQQAPWNAMQRPLSNGSLDLHHAPSWQDYNVAQRQQSTSPQKALQSQRSLPLPPPLARPAYAQNGAHFGPQDSASLGRPPSAQNLTHDSPVTPNGSPPPPLPTQPPLPEGPPPPQHFSGGSQTALTASPITPEAPLPNSPRSPAMQTGAYIEDRGSEDDAVNAPKGGEESQLVSKDWKVPSWSIQQPANGHAGQHVNEALAAPLPVGHGTGVPPPAAPESDGVPSIEGSPSPTDGAEAWSKPDSSFEDFVGRVIAHRLGKYKQAGHPNRISRQDFKDLYKKSWKAIIDAERKAFDERQRLSTFKQIERHKLETRIKDYVRELIKRHHERKSVRG